MDGEPSFRKGMDLRDSACDPHGGKGGIAFHILTPQAAHVPEGTDRQWAVTAVETTHHRSC
jgi:hypothetical protein